MTSRRSVQPVDRTFPTAVERPSLCDRCVHGAILPLSGGLQLCFVCVLEEIFFCRQGPQYCSVCDVEETFSDFKDFSVVQFVF